MNNRYHLVNVDYLDPERPGDQDLLSQMEQIREAGGVPLCFEIHRENMIGGRRAVVDALNVPDIAADDVHRRCRAYLEKHMPERLVESEPAPLYRRGLGM